MCPTLVFYQIRSLIRIVYPEYFALIPFYGLFLLIVFPTTAPSIKNRSDTFSRILSVGYLFFPNGCFYRSDSSHASFLATPSSTFSNDRLLPIRSLTIRIISTDRFLRVVFQQSDPAPRPFLPIPLYRPLRKDRFYRSSFDGRCYWCDLRQALFFPLYAFVRISFLRSCYWSFSNVPVFFQQSFSTVTIPLQNRFCRFLCTDLFLQVASTFFFSSGHLTDPIPRKDRFYRPSFVAIPSFATVISADVFRGRFYRSDP